MTIFTHVLVCMFFVLYVLQLFLCVTSAVLFYISRLFHREGAECMLDIVQFEPYRNISFYSTRLVVIQMVKKFHVTEPKTC